MSEQKRVYSIRVPRDAHAASCPHCGKSFQAAGPTAYAGDEAICDKCLLGEEPELGSLLALFSVVRTLAFCSYPDREAYLEALAEVGALVRVLERHVWGDTPEAQ
jgi:hypothetical protein